MAYTLAAERPARSAGDALLSNPLMDVLHAVRERGSISAAARQLDLSYRHVWGQLKEWENQLGRELLVWERGQAAQLSPFGQRLLMAERLAQARLGPQVEHLRVELERAFAKAFEDPDAGSHLLTLYASHDHALGELQDLAATDGSQPKRLDLDRDAERALDSVPGLIVANWVEGRMSAQPFEETAGR